MRLRRVCAWCDPPRILDDGDPGAETTHTICNGCIHKFGGDDVNEDIDCELTISDAVWATVGLDDSARYPDITRIATRGGFRCIGKRSALVDLVTEISDRATEGADGFDEPADVKRECRRALRMLAKNGWKPRP